jgi:undecaprenyl-diphosphatase
MTVLQSILLGMLQGATEFLPVSSSGHLAVVRSLWGLTEIPLLYDVLLHVATLLVVVIVFRTPIVTILGAVGRFVRRKNSPEDRPYLRLVLIIALASVFTAIIGYGISTLDVGRNPKVVSALFIVTGAILIAAHFAKGTHDYGSLGPKAAIITGVAQGFGVFPGISRSGITISAALAAGISRERAGEYSFLLSIPAILGALMLQLREGGELAQAVSTGALIAGFVASFVVGLLSLILLLRLVRRGQLYLFSLYLVPLGIVGLIAF